jgi:putative oxidoreductase
MRFSFAITLAIRYLLVVLFFPFSALDKILNFQGAVTQAKEVVPADKPAKALIASGLCLEVLGPLAILTGKYDRLAAFLMAGYCGTTALFWKRFWEPGDFWHPSPSRGRDLFWDFLKNFSLAGGFLLITFGTRAEDEPGFLADPLSSSRPYARRKGARNGR